MSWYFGGGLRVGHPSRWSLTAKAGASRHCGEVSVNYRLNAFGFVPPDITAQQPDAPANWPPRWQAGTRWVKRNIADAGGDPEAITIGGQSAGGMVQLTSPQNEDC